MGFQENGLMCAVSSSHPVSGIFACTVVFEIPHEILGIKPTTQSCHQEVWIHLLHVNARLVAHLETSTISGQSSGKETVRTTTRRITWPSTQENHVAIRVRKRDNSRRAPDAMRPPRCSASEFHEYGTSFRRRCQAPTKVFGG